MPPKRNKVLVKSEPQPEKEKRKPEENAKDESVEEERKEVLLPLQIPQKEREKKEKEPARKKLKEEKEENEDKKETKATVDQGEEKEKGRKKLKEEDSEDEQKQNSSSSEDEETPKKDKEEKKDENFAGWNSDRIVQYWLLNNPRSSKAFPDSPSDINPKNFLGSTVGVGRWRFKPKEDAQKQGWKYHDDYVNAIFEYNYRRGVRHFFTGIY
jgi:hypothetical protein